VRYRKADGSCRDIPEGILDAVVTVAIAMHDIQGRGHLPTGEAIRNSRAGSIYVVKPKLHGPTEVAFSAALFAKVEALLGLPALAHDMWLVPPESPRPGAAVEVEVSVGMDFPTSLTAMAPERLTVTVVGPEGRSAAATLEADEERHRTTATFTPTEPGAWLLAATSMPNRIELEAAKFNDYLLHDGLPHVLAGRMDRGELDRDATERYSKYVKTLVPVGSTARSDRATLEPLGS
jgi:hypothetical protein